MNKTLLERHPLAATFVLIVVSGVVAAVITANLSGIGGAIGLGVDGHAGDAHLPAGPDHAHRDLSAVGDQDLLEPSLHRGMLPCFLGGFWSRLVRAMSRPVMILRRVCRGSITSSMKPRSAAA